MYTESEVYALINRAIIWNTDNKSTPLVDWWDENKKPESPSTPLSVEEAAKEDAFIKKHLAIIREKTMDSMIEMHIVRKRDLLRPSIEHFLSGGNCNGMFRIEILEMLNLAYKWNDQPSTPIPSDIVQALTDANPYQTGDDTEGAYYAGWENCISKLRELLSSQPSQKDYEEVLADHQRLVRELDVLLNGENGAAKNPSLCDIVAQVEKTGVVIKSSQGSVQGGSLDFMPVLIENYEAAKRIKNDEQLKTKTQRDALVECFEDLISIYQNGAWRTGTTYNPIREQGSQNHISILIEDGKIRMLEAMKFSAKEAIHQGATGKEILYSKNDFILDIDGWIKQCQQKLSALQNQTEKEEEKS